MKRPILFFGRSRGALIHVFSSRENGKTVAVCGARITTRPLFYGRGCETGPHCWSLTQGMT